MCECRTLAVLDAESVDHYWLTVHATDHGAVPLSSKVVIKNLIALN